MGLVDQGFRWIGGGNTREAQKLTTGPVTDSPQNENTFLGFRKQGDRNQLAAVGEIRPPTWN